MLYSEFQQSNIRLFSSHNERAINKNIRRRVVLLTLSIFEMLQKAYLLTGSNRGNRLEMLDQARQYIDQQAVKILASSSLYETAPWGFHDQIHFLNQAHCIETFLSPNDLIAFLLQIESNMGRTREGQKYTGRLIDIDILLYANQIVDQEHLKIPHPRMHNRRFTLVPLAEIAGNIMHPVLNLSISELLELCSDTREVRLFETKPLTLNTK